MGLLVESGPDRDELRLIHMTSPGIQQAFTCKHLAWQRERVIDVK